MTPLRRTLLVLLALVPLTVAAFSLSDQGPSWRHPQPPRGSRAGAASVAMPEAMNTQPTPGQRYVSRLLSDASAQVRAGAHQYHLVCEACHGASGQGLAEGRLSFPPSHQYCEQCHHPYNAPLWQDVNIGPHNAFNLGDPPPLRGPGSLAALPNAEALYQVIRSTMPRYRPGDLSDRAYLGLTAFVLALRGQLAPSATLSQKEAAGIALHAPTPTAP